MKYFKSMNLFCIALFASLTIVSCSKDDSITETDKEVKLEATFDVNNRSVTTNAYAAFCSDNGKELLNVSNNQELLKGFPFDWDDLQTDDFFFQYVIDGDVAYATGGSVFGEDLGFLDQQSVFDAATTYDITSNDGSVVSGMYSGNFLAFNNDMELFQFPYSLSFNAEIVEVADFCN